jgi:hypothetical protein
VGISVLGTKTVEALEGVEAARSSKGAKSEVHAVARSIAIE